MVFVMFCHHLDDNYVKGNFILFAVTMESLRVLCPKTPQYSLDSTAVFAVLTNSKEIFFSIFSQIQSRSDGVCSILPHTWQ